MNYSPALIFQEGTTALMVAALGCRARAVELLYEHGAHVDVSGTVS
jgi:hypothetical protein